MPKINFKNDAAPSTPPTGYTSLYAKTDKLVYIKKDDGSELSITAAPAVGTPVAQTPDQSNSAGVASTYALSDHVHNIPTAAAVSISTSSTNTQGNAATFARSNHTHAVSLASSTASATASTTTTSTTAVLLDSMTISNPDSGSYLVNFNTSTVNSGNGATRNFFVLYVGGSPIAVTLRSIGIGGGAYSDVNIAWPVTVNGSQSIEIYWYVTAGTGTSLERTLSAVKIG